MKYFLSVIAIFKNESLIIKEWIEHYLCEGVNHFYLIDNDSTDNYSEILRPYISEGLIDLQIDKRSHMQTEHYNSHYLKKIKEQSEWIIIVDLDEFIYSRGKFRTIVEYLKTQPDTTSQIYVPWKMFGSNGHIEQPSECARNFTMRNRYNLTKTCSMSDNERILTKTVVRTKYLLTFGIHFSFLCENKGTEITSDNKPLSGKEPAYLQPINENILTQSALHCNHYPIQSFNWYKLIKMTRGSASTVDHDKVRTYEYYNNYDSNCELDDKELALKWDLKIYYGQNKFIDVTRKICKQFMDTSGKKIVIDEKYILNHCLGDPEPFVEKCLVVRQHNKIKLYPENGHGTIVINFL
jgi:hypothetical protein